MNFQIIFVIGVYMIEYLQEKLWSYNDIIPAISQIFDPKFGYSVVFPIVFAFSNLCGLRMIYAIVLSEYLNMMLKWILQEDRPYWWVNEHSDQVYNLTLTQFPMTCETGPGSPSGHVMISTTLWYIIVATLVKKLNYLSSVIVWLCYFALLFAIAISRMFIAAHFPHQCLLGFLIGLGLGRSCMGLKWIAFQADSLIVLALTLFSTTLGLYYLLAYLNMDPNRSIDMAIKWCALSANVHLDTTPLFCCMRYCGVTLGLGVAHCRSTWREKFKLKSNPRYCQIAIAILGLAFSKIVSLISYPKDAYEMYWSSVQLHSLLMMLIARASPEIVIFFSPDSQVKKEVLKVSKQKKKLKT